MGRPAHSQYGAALFNDAVYTGVRYCRIPFGGRLDQLMDELGWRKERVPEGADPKYIQVEDGRDLDLLPGDIVYLNQWDRIDGLIKGRTEYCVSET